MVARSENFPDYLLTDCHGSDGDHLRHSIPVVWRPVLTPDLTKSVMRLVPSGVGWHTPMSSMDFLAKSRECWPQN